MIAITCFACPEEPLLEKPPDAKNPIVELINTIKNIPRSALIADIFFILNSAMTYEKGCWESHFFATTIYKGKNTLEDTPEKKRYQDGISFFFTVNLVNSLVCFAYSWANTFVVNKLGFKLSLFIPSIMHTTGLIMVIILNSFNVIGQIFANVVVGIPQKAKQFFIQAEMRKFWMELNSTMEPFQEGIFMK